MGRVGLGVGAIDGVVEGDAMVGVTVGAREGTGVGVSHIPLVQLPLSQSVERRQVCSSKNCNVQGYLIGGKIELTAFARHSPQSLPPQSISVSR